VSTGNARSPRDEAVRLVTAALATASVAARSASGLATGSAECCVCPVCRAITAVRDPSPELVERLASGVGDLAAGLADVLRALGTTGEDDRPAPDAACEDDRPAPDAAGEDDRPAPDAAGEAEADAADPWRAATHAAATPRGHHPPPAGEAGARAV